MSKYVTISFKMNRMASLPSTAILKQFNKYVNEVNPFTSGAALTQLIEKGIVKTSIKKILERLLII
ncbi:hypothetical protein [Lactobacillus sp. ESL0228]|uniref:hypothetical protein n=1 Tax=Lactobacillus sp. ESL0228 TaxID=2069352 RepID=UPI000EFA8E1E|nr:hypothetical protein [Lactobacillus sp. ESL0228]RMC49654.1 hypothetical protein F5ESL0228_02725 [Lactobacillus sp. ESL0228]